MAGGEAAPKQTTSGSTQSVAGVERALDVLSQFISVPEVTWGVTELAEAMGMSKAVVHRILVSCRGRGWLAFDEDTKKYRLGTQALHLGLAATARFNLGAEVRSSLQRLAELTEETATHSVRVGWNRVYVDQAPSVHDIRMVVQIGASYPLHAGATGKAMLAFQPEEFREGYLCGQKLGALTASTSTNPLKLRDELARIREQGWASSVGERQIGAAAVAAPVLDRTGTAVGVLSVCGPHDRVEQRIEELAPAVLEQTSRLAARLGFLAPGMAVELAD